jgi:hypothetical protein
MESVSNLFPSKARKFLNVPQAETNFDKKEVEEGERETG